MSLQSFRTINILSVSNNLFYDSFLNGCLQIIN